MLYSQIVQNETGTQAYAALSFDFYHMNNADFQNYSKKKYMREKVLPGRNSDDALYYSIGLLEAGYYRKFSISDIRLCVSKYGYFGNDNFENADDADNPLRVHEANIGLFAGKAAEIRTGRMHFDLGSAVHDYFFSDTIDGALVALRLFPALETKQLTLSADIMSNTVDRELVYSGSAVRQDTERMDDFKGMGTSWRAGMLLDFLFIKSFHYYLEYGANSHGAAEIAQNGKNDVNEPDRDYLTQHGLRLYHCGRSFACDLTFAWSRGRDTQSDDVRNYNAWGAAANISFAAAEGIPIVPLLEKFTLSGGWFHPDYCSMKAETPAGLVLFTQKAYYLSPYAGAYHFSDGQKDKDSIGAYDANVAKGFVKTGFTLRHGIFGFYANYLALCANESRKSLISNIPGKELKGRGNFIYMGSEFEAGISCALQEITLSLSGGIYLPGTYYTRRSQYNTFFSEGRHAMYGVCAGCSHRFRF